MKIIIYSLILASMLANVAVVSVANAAIEERQFENPEYNERFKNLIAELRCLVCQNQNLADSDASLARDLRDKTAEMLIAGKTDREILDYMSERYGEFVLYRPPFNLMNSILWVGPFLILLIVIVMLRRNIRQRQASINNDEKNTEQRRKVKDLLQSAPDLNQKKNH